MTVSRPYALAVVALVGFLTFSNTLRSPFLYDDAGAIVANSSIRDLGDLAAVASPPPETAISGRPLVNFTFAINYAVGADDPFGYHVVNIALHVACAFLLFLIMGRVTGSAAIALAVAVIWEVHPLNSEVVDYLTQRTESAMGLMLLTVFYCSLPQGRQPGTRQSKSAPAHQPIHGRLAIAACIAGMACKETMAVAPVLVVLYDRLIVFDSLRSSFRARGRFYLGLFSSWILLAVLVLWRGQTATAGFAHTATGASWLQYFMNQPGMILRYLRLFAWPGPLVTYYGWTPAVTWGDVWLPFVMVSALFLGTLVLVVVRPRIGFLCAAFFLLLGPASSFIPIATEVGAERRMYLPSITLVIMVVVLGADLIRRARERFGWSASRQFGFGATVVALVVVPLGVRTVYRNAEYQSSLVLSRTLLDRWPTPNAHQLYGAALSVNGQHDAAIAEFRTAVTGYPLARYFLGAELVDTGKTDEGVAELERFVAEEPTQEAAPVAHGILADVYFQRQAYQTAIPHYRAIIAAQPQNATAWTGLGVALASSGAINDAVAAFRRAVDVEPTNGQYRANLARAEAMIRR